MGMNVRSKGKKLSSFKRASRMAIREKVKFCMPFSASYLSEEQSNLVLIWLQ